LKLSLEVLKDAYRLGVFPMAEARESDEIMWVRPEWRGIFPLDGLRVSRSLRRVVKRDVFEVRVDHAFRDVVEACGEEKAGREETWINPAIIDAYCALHAEGNAHSVECYQDGSLVGGLYGVSLGGAFFGESMFSRESNASKVALCHLAGRLRLAGYTLLDTQFITDHLASLGAVEISATAYEQRLAEALRITTDFAAVSGQMSGSSILQSITQTS
jgi:leucyl/phenylalanyl-tRNA--protein transferase